MSVFISPLSLFTPYESFLMFQVKDQVFTISNLKYSLDSGEYECRASNAAGEKVQMKKGRLLVRHCKFTRVVCS